MLKKQDVSLEQATAGLPIASNPCITALHNKAIQSGLIPFGTKSSKKPDYYKIEYKKSKKDSPIYVLTVKGEKWDLKCKLFHLDKYVALLYKLSESALHDILMSRECRGPERGCIVGVKFKVNEKSYNLCRHGIFFRQLVLEDVEDVWALMKAEIFERAEQN